MSERIINRLEIFNRWRRGEDIEQPNPKQIGEDIDELLRMVKNQGSNPVDYKTPKLFYEELDALRQEVERLREALQSIANSTCCYNCNQAAIVAREALAPQIKEQGK